MASGIIAIYRNSDKIAQITELYNLENNIDQIEKLIADMMVKHNIEDSYSIISRVHGQVKERRIIVK